MSASRRVRRLVLLSSTLVIAVLGAACSVPSSPGGSGDGTEIVLGEAYEDETLHPLMGYGVDGASKIFDGLVTHDANRVVRPALATEVPEPAADGRSYTVRLREGVRFHDGSSFEAADVVATYRTLLDPASASPLTTEFAMISGVEEVDERTVRFDLAYPYAPLPTSSCSASCPARRRGLAVRPDLPVLRRADLHRVRRGHRAGAHRARPR
ncbi:MAG: ABC transporter substrate-binding protein [Pseudonocardiaceae bacterium]